MLTLIAILFLAIAPIIGLLLGACLYLNRDQHHDHFTH